MKAYYSLISVIIVALVMSSCTKDEAPIFSDTPAERINQQKTELMALLTQEAQGYKGTYFSKNDEYGGATFYFKFNTNGTVQSTSDFDNNNDIGTSSYRVSTGTSAAELVFEDRGHIQKMSDPSQEGLVGKGFKGTSVFQYFGNNNGVITLRDIRNSDTGFLTLTPSGFTNFETESVASVNNSFTQRQEFTQSSNVTAFPLLSVSTQQTEFTYDLNYDALRFFAAPSKQNEDGTVSEEKFGLLFTEDGLIISPSLTVGDVTFEKFEKDTSTGVLRYISTVGNNTATIGYATTPATPLDAYAFGVRRSNAVYNDYEPNKSSWAFNQFYQQYAQSVNTQYALTFNYIILRNLNNGQVPYILFSTNYGNVWYEVNFTVENGIVKFNLTGDTNASALFNTILQPLLNKLLLEPQGYYLKKTGGLLNYSNRTFSMISVADPTMWINYYDF